MYNHRLPIQNTKLELGDKGNWENDNATYGIMRLRF